MNTETTFTSYQLFILAVEVSFFVLGVCKLGASGCGQWWNVVPYSYRTVAVFNPNYVSWNIEDIVTLLLTNLFLDCHLAWIISLYTKSRTFYETVSFLDQGTSFMGNWTSLNKHHCKYINIVTPSTPSFWPYLHHAYLFFLLIQTLTSCLALDSHIHSLLEKTEREEGTDAGREGRKKWWSKRGAFSIL